MGVCEGHKRDRKCNLRSEKNLFFILWEKLDFGQMTIGIYQQNHRHKTRRASTVRLIQLHCTHAMQELLFLSYVKEYLLFTLPSINPNFLKMCNADQPTGM